MLLCSDYVQGGTYSFLCIWCFAHVRYAVLWIDDAMYMLDMQCYVHVLLHACFTCGAMYIWCCVHDCTSDDVCMWWCVHVGQVALCVGGVVYMSRMWNCVYVVWCTCLACGTMYMSATHHVWHAHNITRTPVSYVQHVHSTTCTLHYLHNVFMESHLHDISCIMCTQCHMYTTPPIQCVHNTTCT